MKLSEMTTEQAAQALVKIADPIERMMSDEKLETAFVNFANLYKSNPTVIKLTGEVLGKLVPTLLKEHAEDLYQVVSAMTGKTTAEVRKEKLTTFIRDCMDFVDKDFIDFFQNTGTSETEQKVS